MGIYGRLGSVLTSSMNLSTVFTLSFLIFSCVLPSVAFDYFYISLSRVPDISISFLFWVGQGSCSVEDCIFPSRTFLSSAFGSALSDGCTLEDQGVSLGGAQISTALQITLSGSLVGLVLQCIYHRRKLIFGPVSLIFSGDLSTDTSYPLIECISPPTFC